MKLIHVLKSLRDLRQNEKEKRKLHDDVRDDDPQLKSGKKKKLMPGKSRQPLNDDCRSNMQLTDHFCETSCGCHGASEMQVDVD